MEGKEVKFGEVAEIRGESVGAIPLFAAIDGAALGISYRQWLIGQALAGTMMEGSYGSTQSAELAIRAADAVIAKLDAEGARDTFTTDMFEQEVSAMLGGEAGHQCCGGCK